MKKHIQHTIWFLAPIALWAQVQEPASAEIDLVEVTVVEDGVNSVAPSTTSAEIVEIPEAAVEGARIDPAPPSIPEVTESLPVDTEIVLEIPGQGSSLPGEASLDTEETISIDFPDEDIRTILRNVADLFELNLVIPDTLQGRTSIKLRNISWRQAFEVVLDPLGYTFVEDRNIIRIKSIEDLTTEPVDTRVFVVNYARAGDLQSSIAPLVNAAAGGRIQVDTRSNALVITERPTRMNKIQEIIERLDRATDQVMIESKFVEVSQADEGKIGVNWAFLDQNPEDLLGGNGTFSNTASGGDTAFPVTGLPAGEASGGLLAVFSRQQFGAVVTALDSDSSSKLVSQPTVVVMNNRPANFEVGVDYPVREITFNQETGQYESGALEKIFIGVKLDVTPSVNAQGMISLNVAAELSEIGGAGFAETVPNPAGGEDPIVSKRLSQTDVTIKDGFTIALGGLVSTTKSVSDRGIPLFKEIPLFGNLFKSQSDTTNRSNLIIFITANTLNPDGTDYREIIDPRVLDSVGHTEAQGPGYVVPEEDMRLLKEAEDRREAAEHEQFIQKMESESELRALEDKSLLQKLKLKN